MSSGRLKSTSSIPSRSIATIDSPDGVIDMDIWITQDRGYKPAELQESYSIGEIPIDAIYTPIERVNFVVEHTRVGPMTDYDRLIIEVLTDGTIEPDDALAEAARILMTQAQVFAGFTQGECDRRAAPASTIPEEILNKPLIDLGLSPRVLNALRSRQIERVGQVLTADPEQLLSIRNFGPRSLTELRQKLAEFGYLPEGEEPMAGVEFLDEFELADESLDELDGDLLAADDEMCRGGCVPTREMAWHAERRRRGGTRMRHRKAGRKFGRNPAQRRALIRQLAISMILHERLTTTEAKAKSLRPVVEKLVTIARSRFRASPQSGHVEDRPRAGDRRNSSRSSRLDSKQRLVATPEFRSSASRHGDAAPMALIEFVEA